MSDFSKLPTDAGTRPLSRIEAELDGHPVMVESWYWEGISGQSLIFIESDVSELTDQDLVDRVRTAMLVDPDSEITLRRNDGFVFVNYAFEIL